MSRGWPAHEEPVWNIWDVLDICLNELRQAQNARLKHPAPKRLSVKSSNLDNYAMRKNVSRAVRKRCFKRPN